MKRFSVFIKSNKFQWSPNSIVLASMVIFSVISLVNSNITHQFNQLIEKIIAVICLIIFSGALIRRFLMIGKPEKLNGVLEGFLELHSDFIIINDKRFKLNEIEKIIIENDDYYGKPIGNGRGFSSNFSSGINNYFTLILKDKTKVQVMFEIYNIYDMTKNQELILHYYNLNLVSLDNLKSIFKLNKVNFQDLKNQLQNQ